MQRTATSQQELGAAQHHVLAALLEGRSVTDAAQGTGVGSHDRSPLAKG